MTSASLIIVNFGSRNSFLLCRVLRFDSLGKWIESASVSLIRRPNASLQIFVGFEGEEGEAFDHVLLEERVPGRPTLLPRAWRLGPHQGKGLLAAILLGSLQSTLRDLGLHFQGSLAASAVAALRRRLLLHYLRIRGGTLLIPTTLHHMRITKHNLRARKNSLIYT